MKKAMVLMMGTASIVAMGTLAVQAIPLNSYAIVADMKCGINIITSTGTVRIDLKTTAHTPQLAAIGISSPPTVRSAL